jgi:hypothetical protein
VSGPCFVFLRSFCFCFYLLSLNFTRLGFGFVPILRVSAPGLHWDAGPDFLLVGFPSLS